jgi:hypothetical protein
VAKHFLHQQLLSSYRDVSDVELVFSQRLPVLCLRDSPADPIEEVGCGSTLSVTTKSILFSLFRYFKLALCASVLLLVSSWVIAINVSIQHNYSHKVADPFESFDFLYDKPWQRFGPYAMGN